MKIIEPITIVLAGPPKIGKTHLAFTASNDRRTYSFDSEHGQDFVIHRHFSENKQLTKYDVTSYLQLKEDMNEVVSASNPGDFLILDSFTDILSIFDEQVEKEVEMANVKKKNENTQIPYYAKYGRVDKRLIKILDIAKNKKKMNLILTVHVDPVYRQDAKGVSTETGRLTAKLRKKYAHFVDVIGVYQLDKNYWDFTTSRFKMFHNHWTIETDPSKSTMLELIHGLQNPILLEMPEGNKAFKFHPNPNF